MIVSRQSSKASSFLGRMPVQRQCHRRPSQRRYAMVYNFRESSEVQDWRIKEMVDVRCFGGSNHWNVCFPARVLCVDVSYILS